MWIAVVVRSGSSTGMWRPVQTPETRRMPAGLSSIPAGPGKVGQGTLTGWLNDLADQAREMVAEIDDANASS